MSGLIPDPEIVQSRLREVLREAAMLRRLLRLAVRARNAVKVNVSFRENKKTNRPGVGPNEVKTTRSPQCPRRET
jgi:hypothetical protein